MSDGLNAQMTTPADAPFANPNGTIELQNPMTEHFGSFIFGNALHCDHVVERGTAKGQTVVICGAGPSLRDTAPKWVSKGDQVWGCNSAAIWLHDHGYPVTHAFTVDQTPQMIEEWKSAPDHLEYLVGSSIHPHLTEYLLDKGCRLRWFHNFVGVKGPVVSYAVCGDCNWSGDTGTSPCPNCASERIDSHTASYEEWMYQALYPSTVVTGSGLNATTRAIDLALFMGFEKIILLGADCALRMTKPCPNAPTGSPEHLQWLREGTEMHADGGHALASEASSLTLQGEIDGRLWLTKPDMVVTAVWLRSMKKALGSRLSIMGDTLPRVLLNKDDAFIERMPSLRGKDGRMLEFCLPDFLLAA